MMAKQTKLRLFVWEDVLCDYTCGVMFALAENVEQARKKILEHEDIYSNPPELLDEPKVYDEPVGFAVWGGG